MTLGKRIHDRREQLNLSQADLGELVGKDQNSIWRYESGRVQPTAEVLADLARALQTTADYLLGVSDEVTPIGESNLTSLEREAIAILRSQDTETQRRIVTAIRALAGLFIYA